MRITKLVFKNFRGLLSIELSTDSNINVIVGPNAVGKSTLLEAIRLVKVLLAARMPNEAQTALVQMGVLSPNNQAIGAPGIDIPSLANDSRLPIVLRIEFQLTDNDAAILNDHHNDLSLLLLHSETVRDQNESPLAFTQFLSTEVGKASLEAKRKEVTARLSTLVAGATCTLQLTMDHSRREISGLDVFDQSLITILDRRLPPHKTIMSLFPADRALPAGEQPLQLGVGDVIQQLQAHMAMPGSKYARLKQTIIHAIMLNEAGRQELADEFNLIFDQLLPGKRLVGININPNGLLKILVEDIDSGKVLDIDQMSSGEKGLVLTFLFLRMSMQSGGVAFIDEPELHLNAAVQGKLTDFIKKYCVESHGLQVFICTHSPEIVRDAFEDASSRLFHLRSGDDLTPVLPQDHSELFEICERLGSSPADVLFTRGSVYVEGEHDSAVLQAGFPTILSGAKVAGLGGRGEVEREFPNLQAEEKAGRLKKPQLFILDNDRKPSSLKSTTLVRIHQHERYCLENYLLGAVDIIFDLLTEHAKNPVGSRGLFPKILEDAALLQTSELAMRQVYENMVPDSLGMRADDCRNGSFEQVASIMSQRLQGIQGALKEFDKSAWENSFVGACQKKKEELDELWRAQWITLCNGKKVIDELYVRYQISLKKVEFKKAIIRKMASQASDDWRILHDVLTNGLK